MDIIAIILEVLAVIGGSAVLSAFIPNKYKAMIPLLKKIIEILALNIRHAKNADDAK